jgi:diguanylate cyclase (GGDEF)-like protein
VTQLHVRRSLLRIAIHWRRLRRASADLFNVGITARLLVTLAAVAILAAVANLIVEQGVPVVQILRIVRDHPEHRMSMDGRAARAAPGADSRTRAETLRRSAAHLELATVARISDNSIELENQFQSASKDLRAAAAEYLAQSPSFSSSQRRRWAASIDDYESESTTLLAAADTRRQLVDEYAASWQTIMARLDASLNRGWRVFGHVIARQSLVELRSRLDALRLRTVNPGATGGVDTAQALAIADSESEVVKALDHNRSSLARLEGAAWMDAMDSDLTRLSTLRQAITAIEGTNAAGMREFLNTGTRVVDLPLPLESITVTDLPMSPDPMPLVAASAAAGSPPSDLNGAADPMKSVERAPSAGGALVAWVTAVVLLLLVAISALTVRSIVRPVKEMLNATAKLAAGAADARVRRGGIRELDTLAVAFNGMAEQLAAAQHQALDYQRQLETRVAERTAELQHLAWHDSLTSLPNRHQLDALLHAAINRAARSGRRVGVLFVDIDNFKNLNDSLGHTFGDAVLVAIGARLAASAGTLGFAARWGGDEFTIVHEEADSAEAVLEAGRLVVGAFGEPIQVNGRELIVTVSVGASIYPDHEKTPEDLLSAADAALFQAKALGRGQLAVFTPAMVARAAARFDIEQGLRRAVERQEFELLYQPEVNLETLRVGLVEALLRWRRPDGRLSLPDEFLGVAEETGLIVEVGDWVLKTAIEKTAEWHHGSWPEARVAINVSPRQLMNPRFFDRVQSLLRSYGLPPQCVELELTESVLQTGVKTIECLRRLHDCNIAIALDDFGTGYSSLASLEQLPLRRIKLDRGLVAGIDKNGRSAAIARTIIDLCMELKLAVTAEGIERIEQLQCVLGTRGGFAQGYLLSPPVSCEAVLEVNRTVAANLQELLAATQPEWTDSRTRANIVHLLKKSPTAGRS